MKKKWLWRRRERRLAAISHGEGEEGTRKEEGTKEGKRKGAFVFLFMYNFFRLKFMNLFRYLLENNNF
jgi:hypothetical protein